MKLRPAGLLLATLLCTLYIAIGCGIGWIISLFNVGVSYWFFIGLGFVVCAIHFLLTYIGQQMFRARVREFEKMNGINSNIVGGGNLAFYLIWEGS